MKFEVVMGITPGYPDSWVAKEVGLRFAKLKWIEAMKAEQRLSGRVISAYMTLVDCMYPNSSIDGEPCILVKGNMNQSTEICKVEWMAAVQRVVDSVRIALAQEEVWLHFENVEQHMLTDALPTP